MARPRPFTVPLARTFAASLCVVEGPATSLDVALWLGVVADALLIVDEPDERGLTMRDGLLTAEDDQAPLPIAARTLLEATGLGTHRQLERPFERLAETAWSLGLHDGQRLRLWHGWEAPETPADRQTPVERGLVSGLALAQAMPHDTRFWLTVDVAAMARFRSRFSALIYLRALAWIAGAGTPKAWKRTPPGEGKPVSVTVRSPSSTGRSAPIR